MCQRLSTRFAGNFEAWKSEILAIIGHVSVIRLTSTQTDGDLNDILEQYGQEHRGIPLEEKTRQLKTFIGVVNERI